MAAFIGNNRMINTLLSYKTGINTADSGGRSALHWAVRKHGQTAELLIKKGADVNKPNNDGTSLHFTIQCSPVALGTASRDASCIFVLKAR